MPSPTCLITHSGTFHADDVMAYAILKTVFPEAALVRTRDDSVIDNSGDSVVFDVGFKYDHADRFYDHHMAEGPKRDDTSPYSSVGLIWAHYGIDCLKELLDASDTPLLGQIWTAVDKSLVLEIDLIDNGVGKPSGSDIASLIDDFNSGWDCPARNEDARFLEAAGFAGGALLRRIKKAASSCRAIESVRDAALHAEDRRIVVLPRSMPWEKAIFDGNFTEVLYIVYQKEAEGTFYCTAVPPEQGSFEQRKPLPAAWAGLRDRDLAEATGVKDAVFCHSARFICGARSYEGIMKMAKVAAEA